MLGRFQKHLNSYPPSPELAKGFLAQYSNRAPRTLYRYAQMLRVFMRWYGEPLDFKVKVQTSLPPYTEDSEIEKLFAAIEHKKTHKGLIVRDALLVALDLKTGMRRAELSNLQVNDIHADFLIVRHGKGDKDRVIPLSPVIATRLKNFVQDMKPDERVFKLAPPTITMKIKQFARKAGLENFHLHLLRHKFAQNLLEKGANIKAVQELLGHTNLNTTEVYLSVTNKGLRDAVKLLEEQTPDKSDLIPEGWEEVHPPSGKVIVMQQKAKPVEPSLIPVGAAVVTETNEPDASLTNTDISDIKKEIDAFFANLNHKD